MTNPTYWLETQCGQRQVDATGFDDAYGDGGAMVPAFVVEGDSVSFPEDPDAAEVLGESCWKVRSTHMKFLLGIYRLRDGKVERWSRGREKWFLATAFTPESFAAAEREEVPDPSDPYAELRGKCWGNGNGNYVRRLTERQVEWFMMGEWSSVDPSYHPSTPDDLLAVVRAGKWRLVPDPSLPAPAEPDACREALQQIRESLRWNGACEKPLSDAALLAHVESLADTALSTPPARLEGEMLAMLKRVEIDMNAVAVAGLSTGAAERRAKQIADLIHRAEGGGK